MKILRWVSAVVVATLVLVGLSTVPAYAQGKYGPDSLTAGQSLRPPGSSAHAVYELSSNSGMFSLVIYDDHSQGGGEDFVGIEVGESDPGIGGSNWTVTGRGDLRSSLSLQTDGNLVFYAAPGRAIWSTKTAGTGSHNRLTIQDDGNLVLRNNAGKTLWQSRSGKEILSTGQRIGPGQRLINVHASSSTPTTLTMRPDGDLVVGYRGAAVWASNTHVAGSYATMQSDGNLVIYGGGRALWSTRTAGRGGVHGIRIILDVSTNGRFELQALPGDAGGAIHGIWLSSTKLGETGLLHAQSVRSLLTAGSVLKPGMYVTSDNRYRLLLQTDGNLVLRSPSGAARWSSGTAGHAGTYLQLGRTGDLAVYSGTHVLWHSDTATNAGDRRPINLSVDNDGTVVMQTGFGKVAWSVS